MTNFNALPSIYEIIHHLALIILFTFDIIFKTKHLSIYLKIKNRASQEALNKK